MLNCILDECTLALMQKTKRQDSNIARSTKERTVHFKDV